MAYIGAEPLPGQNREVDDISSSFNGSTTAFTLQVSGVNVSPETANNILVNIGGVIQNPGTDYTIAASTITFTTAPASGLSFFAIILGAGINTATVADQTIGTSKILDNAVTADKLAHTSVTAGSYTTADITVDAQGRITAAASGTIANAEIADGAITNAKVNASAAIARTKLANVDVVDDTTPQLGGDLQSNGNDIDFADNDKAVFGGGSDLKIYYTGTQGRIENAASGELRIQGDTIQITDKEANDMHIQCLHDGAVELYHDNTKMIETTSTGTKMPDGKFAKFGAGDDMSMGHNTFNYITYTGASFQITGDTTNNIMLRPVSNETSAQFVPNGEVELFYDNALRFETQSGGVKSSGQHTFADSSDTSAGFTHCLVSGTVANNGTFTAQTHNCHAGGMVTITTNRRPSGSNNKNIGIFPIVLNSTSNATLGSALSSMAGSSGSSFSVAGTSQGVIVTNTSGLDQRITVRFDICGF